MNETLRLRLFFSHSSHDASWVERVAEKARAAEVEVYLAEHDSQPGRRLSEKVIEAIRLSDALIVLLTKNSLHSPYVHQEIGVATQANMLVIPVLMDDAIGEDLGILNGVEYIRLDPANPHEGLDQLSATLNRMIEGQQAALAEAKRKQDRDMLIAGGVLLVVALIIISQSGNQ